MLAEPLNIFLCENLTLDILLDFLQQEQPCIKPPIVGQIAWGLVLEQIDVENKRCQVPVDMLIFVFEICVWNSNNFQAENFMPLKGQKQSIK